MARDAGIPRRSRLPTNKRVSRRFSRWRETDFAEPAFSVAFQTITTLRQAKDAVRMTTKVRTALALLLLCAAAVGLAATRTGATRDTAKRGANVVAAERDGFRYEYHVLTGHEALYATRGDLMTNVIEGHRGTAASIRAALEAELGGVGLETLRANHADSIRRLRALGYL
jgi:hypothetical protein